jgi:hypothetical protein
MMTITTANSKKQPTIQIQFELGDPNKNPILSSLLAGDDDDDDDDNEDEDEENSNDGNESSPCTRCRVRSPPPGGRRPVLILVCLSASRP